MKNNDLNIKIVEEVLKDFRERSQRRKSFDLIWQMNMNYLIGNQYCNVGYGGSIEESDRQYFWQEREVFNHIAPIIDVRYAKLSRVKPTLNVLPSTNDERDKQTAKVSKKILDSLDSKLKLSSKVRQANKWCEVCGTAFYKITWNASAGQVVGIDEDGKEIRSGEVDISVCSPFEIYPDSATCESLEECQSIIHAKAYTVEQIREMFNVDVQSEKINVFSLDSVSVGLGGLGVNGTAQKMIETTRNDSAIVIEKYIRPNASYPEGRLIIIAGDKLVYDDILPYFCGEDGRRDFPFVRQTAIDVPGCFWGESVIERLIPVQRAYNAVKNRKHEFINRLSLGVLSVEDGSVDLDNLEDEGLCPGKVLVYRQGSNQPKYLACENIPAGLTDEEDKLLDEFAKIAGASETLGTEYVSANISGVALELLINQDETRLNSTIESIKLAQKDIAKRILRLYKQFALFPRLARIVGEKGQIEMFYFTSSDISSDDVEIEAESNIVQNLSQRREMVFELLKNGLLEDENGKLSNRMKSKVFDMLGLGSWENGQDLNELHIKEAGNENLKMIDGVVIKPSEIDDHKLHVNEHIAFMLGGDFEKTKIKNSKIEAIFLEHIRTHKKMVTEEN